MSKQQKIMDYARCMMDMYKNVRLAFDEKFFDEAERCIRSQGYRDALEGLKRYELIKDYDLAKGTIEG